MSVWQHRHIYFWEQAPFFRLLLPLLLSIILYDSGYIGPYKNVWLLCAIPLLLMLCLLFVRKYNDFFAYIFSVLLQIAAFALGWLLVQTNDVRNNTNWYGHLPATANVVEVISELVIGERIVRVEVRMNFAINDDSICKTSGNAILNVYKSDSLNLSVGDRLIVPASWQPITNAGNPFEFDYATFCRRKQLFAQQFISYHHIAKLSPKSSNTNIGFIAKIHNMCASQLDTYVRDTTARGLLNAMLLGEDRSFDPELRDKYARTGVIHIISISGSHVGILFLVITILFSFLKSRHAAIIKYLIGISVIWLYVLIAGAPPSALRAAIMFTIVTLGMSTSKASNPLNNLFAAAFVLLVMNPYWLFSAGFQLSFAAMLGLILFYRPMLQFWVPENKILGWAYKVIIAGFAAQVFTVPLGIYYFHNFPLLSFIANIFATLLLGGVVLIGGMLVIILAWIPVIANAIGWFLGITVAFFNYMIDLFEQLSPTSLAHLYINSIQFWLLFLSVSLFGIATLHKKRNAFLGGILVANMLLISLCITKYQRLEQHKLVVYNTGRNAFIELINGQHVHRFSDTILAENSVVKAAHIGWFAWRKTTLDTSRYFSFRGKKVLLWDEQYNLDSTCTLPVDILLIKRNLYKIDPVSVIATINPQMIVMTGNVTRKQATLWKDSCRKYKMPIHFVGTDGAYVID